MYLKRRHKYTDGIQATKNNSPAKALLRRYILADRLFPELHFQGPSTGDRQITPKWTILGCSIRIAYKIKEMLSRNNHDPVNISDIATRYNNIKTA